MAGVRVISQKAAAPRSLHNRNRNRGNVLDAAVALEGLPVLAGQVTGEEGSAEVDDPSFREGYGDHFGSSRMPYWAFRTRRGAKS